MPRPCAETPGSTQAEALPEAAEPLRHGVCRRLLRTFRCALLFWLRARRSASSPSRIRSSGRSARRTTVSAADRRVEQNAVMSSAHRRAGRVSPCAGCSGGRAWAEPKGEALS